MHVVTKSGIACPWLERYIFPIVQGWYFANGIPSQPHLPQRRPRRIKGKIPEPFPFSLKPYGFL
jgi:hypothetical protein